MTGRWPWPDATELDLTGEHGLIYECVRQAVETLFDDACGRKRTGLDRAYTPGVAARDRAWVASSSREPFSFAWCCQALGFEPRAIRDKIEAILQGARRRYGKAIKEQTNRKSMGGSARTKRNAHPRSTEPD